MADIPSPQAGGCAPALDAFTTYAEAELRLTDSDVMVATARPGQHDIALRLALCWNACRSISTADLMTKIAQLHDAVSLARNCHIPYGAKEPAAPDPLEAVRQAIRDYHFALDNREHGGEAEARAFEQIVIALRMPWFQGQESAARATQQGAANG
jgi:hypothetical protein